MSEERSLAMVAKQAAMQDLLTYYVQSMPPPKKLPLHRRCKMAWRVLRGGR